MIEHTDRRTIYYNDIGQRHRANGPAVEWDDNDWCWVLFGKQHRYYGYQCSFKEYAYREWWIHGKVIKKDLVI